MLFQVDNQTLSNTPFQWSPSEAEIEELIFSNPDVVAQIFQEDILLLKRQQVFGTKRSDILGIDSHGQGVVIELKRDGGILGVDMQALQYLARFGIYKGQKFLDFFSANKESDYSVDEILNFIEVPVEKINESTRIILIARSFDPALFSMGRWLESKGVAFKCICYEPVQIGSQRFLNFSVVFSASPFDEYVFKSFQKIQPRPATTFFHNIGNADISWWNYLRKEDVLTTSYTNLNDPNCLGYRKLSQYIKDDGVFAFVSGVGVVGYGVISDSFDKGYTYRDHNLPAFPQRHFHHLKIQWLSTVDFSKAIQPMSLRDEFGLNWPSGTKQEIRNTDGALKLRTEIQLRAKADGILKRN